MFVDSAKKIFNDEVKELNDASSHRSLFFDNEHYNKVLREVKEAQILWKNNQPPTSKHYQHLKRYDVMKIGDTQKLIVSGSRENDDSSTCCYCRTEKLFDVLETANVNIGHKGTRGKTLICLWFVKTFSLSLRFWIFVPFFQSWKLNWERSIVMLLDKW